MRVLYLTEEQISFSDAMVRGGAIHVRKVVKGLRARGHKVFLVDWNDDSEQAFQRSVAPRSRFVDGPIRTYLQAVAVGRNECVDVIISKTRKTYIPGLVAARRLGVPHIVHVGSSLSPQTNGLGGELDALSFRTRLQAPHDGYFVVCKHQMEELATYGIPDDHLFNVRNAVDTNRFHPERIDQPLTGRFTSQLPDDDRLRLGFVGGLYSYKGVTDLASAVKNSNKEMVVIIAGDGPERAMLEKKLGSNGIFLGPVPYEQIPALYHELDIFVLPSYTEGLPRVVLEAQATGTPLVSTRVGGVPEIVTDGETGLLCPPQNPEALAAQFERIAIDAELRVSLSRAGRKQVLNAFTWEELVNRYERHLYNIVSMSDDTWIDKVNDE